MTVTIALVIPTYNRSALILETIFSALNQSVPFSEIIVVDDGSTDNTIEVLRPYLDRIRIIQIANSGVQNARNVGVRASACEYITFCDSDDLLERDFVNTIGNWLFYNPTCQAVYTNFQHFTKDSVSLDNLSEAPERFLLGANIKDGFAYEIPDLYLRLFTIHPFYIVGCTVRKIFFENIGAFDSGFNGVGAEDGEFTLRVCSFTNPAYCMVPIAKVRRHSGNESANPLHMIMGSARILEYASKNHVNIESYKSALVKESERLHIEAGDRAFSMGKFDIAEKMFTRKFTGQKRWKISLKMSILKMPKPIKEFAWRISQFQLKYK